MATGPAAILVREGRGRGHARRGRERSRAEYTNQRTKMKACTEEYQTGSGKSCRRDFGVGEELTTYQETGPCHLALEESSHLLPQFNVCTYRQVISFFDSSPKLPRRPQTKQGPLEVVRVQYDLSADSALKRWTYWFSAVAGAIQSPCMRYAVKLTAVSVCHDVVCCISMP
eukprot:763081-Hanusia_phi.AAC.1